MIQRYIVPIEVLKAALTNDRLRIPLVLRSFLAVFAQRLKFKFVRSIAQDIQSHHPAPLHNAQHIPSNISLY